MGRWPSFCCQSEIYHEARDAHIEREIEIAWPEEQVKEVKCDLALTETKKKGNMKGG